MNTSTKTMEYTRLDEHGNTLEHKKYKMNWSYTADWGARSLLGHLIDNGFIPTELPEASYNDDGTVHSSFTSERIEQVLLMDHRWRNDTEELFILMQKVLSGEKELSVPIVIRDGETDEEWAGVIETFNDVFPSETIVSATGMRAVLTAFDVLGDAVSRFVLPTDRITVQVVESSPHTEKTLDETSLSEISSLPDISDFDVG